MVITGEGAPIGDELVEHDSERPNIGASAGVLAAKLFGGHIGQGAKQRSGLGLGRRRQAGDTEIDHFDDSIAGHDDIGRLDVAVDHATTMSVIEGTAGLQHVAEPGRQGQRGLAGDDFLQTLAFQILHGNKGSAVDSANS